MEATNADAPVAIFKKRGARGKANLRKRAATPPLTKNESDDSSAFSSSDDEPGQRVKRRKRNAGVMAASRDGTSGDTKLVADTYTANREAPLSSANDATKQSNWYDQEGGDGREAVDSGSRSRPAPGRPTDGTYKGLANQTSFIERNPDAPSKAVGPIKAPTNIRTITVTDFAPDVCKDYKQTGFCGFGDNCKFLHSREDYKQGWQLDKEWETVTKGKKSIAGTVVARAGLTGHDRDSKAEGVEEDEDEEDEALLRDIPFVCIICREPYKEPVVTRCGHYFCESCALGRYRRDPTCAACGVGTSGVFNAAKRLKQLLDRKRERAARRRRAALAAGEAVSSEEDGEEEDS